MSKETSKGPYGKLLSDIRERDGILFKDGKIIVPKRLQPQVIALAHEGHMLADGTLRQLRETMWFRNMRNKVQAYVRSCKCATANPRNPRPPLKLRPRPTEPWKVTAVDYSRLTQARNHPRRRRPPRKRRPRRRRPRRTRPHRTARKRRRNEAQSATSSSPRTRVVQTRTKTRRTATTPRHRAGYCTKKESASTRTGSHPTKRMIWSISG